jgi:hypothetical protein
MDPVSKNKINSLTNQPKQNDSGDEEHLPSKCTKPEYTKEEKKKKGRKKEGKKNSSVF